MKKLLSLFSFLFSLSLALNTSARPLEADINPEIVIRNTLSPFTRGDYLGALKALEPLRNFKERRALYFYWKGLILARLGQYAQSVEAFNVAIQYGAPYEDIYYERGQAQMGLEDYQDAGRSFLLSVKKDFKKAASLYYLGYIAGLLERDEIAIRYFESLARLSESPRELKQAALYRKALLLMKRKVDKFEKKRLVRNEVLPLLEEAQTTLAVSPITDEIRTLIEDLDKRYALSSVTMKNGRALPSKRFDLSLEHRLAFDSNVTLETLNALQRASNKSSLVNTTQLHGAYTFPHNRRWLFTPSVGFLSTIHSSVAENDSQKLRLSWKGTLEHTAYSKMAQTFFDLFYETHSRATSTQGDLADYAKDLGLAVGGSYSFIPGEQTVLRSYFASRDASSSTVKARLYGFEGIQSFEAPEGIYLLAAGMNVTDTDETLAGLIRYDFLASYQRPLPKNWSGRFDLQLAFLDPKASSARGLENELSPGIVFSKALKDWLDFHTGYRFTKAISDEEGAFDYDKHLIFASLEASY